MDFEPILEDTRIGKLLPNLHQVFTIGCIGLNRLINTLVPLSKIGFNDNSSLSDIDRKIEALGIPDDAVFSTEVEFAHRICIDNSNNGKIISINPENLSITLFNSSIDHLATSVIAYLRCFNFE
ncbi:MAG: hypothetical protein F6K22_32025 [Okeania sp. SIO2F4]|uniref:hypothetical protein n=1 Tax=Okeania sp. SIO2F4 TaxID=2607790 RepID=UPI00142BBE26|nr:hypothetical protein [Okeania sp. SIO2F4]NES07026.1 hypothetical protein [Okeania sp. SIO2F4]